MSYPTKLSIGNADKIINHYFQALKKSDGIFKINFLDPYTIQEVILSFKILIAHNYYNQSHSIDQLKANVEKDSAALMLFLIGFQNQEAEKSKSYATNNLQDYMLESETRCFGEEENLESFFQYCSQIRSSDSFWELIFSRLRVLYDTNDTYLLNYFNISSFDLKSSTDFLQYLIYFEDALIALEKNDIDLAFDEITAAYEGLKKLNEVYEMNSTFNYIKGRIEFLVGNPNLALNSLTKSISINPDFGFSYYYRAIVHANLENKLEQENDFMKAEKLGIKRAKRN